MRIVIASVLTLLCSPALAADAIEIAPSPPVAEAERGWTGFWISAGGGGQYAGGDAEAGADWEQSGFPTNIDQYVYAAGTPGELAWFGTVGGGFDFQLSQRFVVGLYGDYTFSQKKTAFIYGSVENGDDYDSYSDVDAYWTLGDNWFVGGRAGILANPETLIYGLAGYTRAKVEAGLDTYAFEDAGLVGENYFEGQRSQWLDGFTVGVGSETMLTERISLKLEYRYTRLGSVEMDRGDLAEDPFYNNLYDLDDAGSRWNPDLHALRAMVSYRF